MAGKRWMLNMNGRVECLLDVDVDLLIYDDH